MYSKHPNAGQDNNQLITYYQQVSYLLRILKYPVNSTYNNWSRAWSEHTCKPNDNQELQNNNFNSILFCHLCTMVKYNFGTQEPGLRPSPWFKYFYEILLNFKYIFLWTIKNKLTLSWVMPFVWSTFFSRKTQVKVHSWSRNFSNFNEADF